MGNTKVEVWKDIDGYENLYQVSNLGRVKSLYRDKVLKPRKHSGGYMRAHLSKDGNSKDFYIHRLVANSFIPNKNGLPQVNHKDGNKQNNNVDNLEWVTSSDNQKHAFSNGLNKSPKAMSGKFGENHNRSKGVIQLDLNNNVIAKYGSISEAHRKTGIGISGISECCRGNYKQSGGYVWKYI